MTGDGDERPLSVFISYRRTDVPERAGRLNDRLAVLLGAHRVFFDFDSIPIGSDFHETIDRAISEVDALVVLIGPNWQPERLFDTDDMVLAELTLAEASKKAVVPVLADDTPMPGAADLPESLQWLARRHALRLRRDPDFRPDVDLLLTGLRRLARPPDPPRPRSGTGRSTADSPSAPEPLTAGSAAAAALAAAIEQAKKAPDTYARILDVLRSIDGVGDKRAGRALSDVVLPPDSEAADLGPRQAEALARSLRRTIDRTSLVDDHWPNGFEPSKLRLALKRSWLSPIDVIGPSHPSTEIGRLDLGTVLTSLPMIGDARASQLLDGTTATLATTLAELTPEDRAQVLRGIEPEYRPLAAKEPEREEAAKQDMHAYIALHRLSSNVATAHIRSDVAAGRFDVAIDRYKSILRLRHGPGRSSAAAELGLLYAHLGDIKEAKRFLALGLRLNDDMNDHDRTILAAELTQVSGSSSASNVAGARRVLRTLFSG